MGKPSWSTCDVRPFLHIVFFLLLKLGAKFVYWDIIHFTGASEVNMIPNISITFQHRISQKQHPILPPHHHIPLLSQ